MKKVIIALIAVIAVLAIALVAFTALTPKQKIESLDNDSLYQYSYVLDKKGLTVFVTGEFPAGSHWEAFPEGFNIWAGPFDKGSKKEQKFLIRPVGNGTDKAILTLWGGEDGNEFLYEIVIEVYSENGQSIALIGNYHREPAETHNEKIGEAAVTISPQADGSIKVFVRGGNAVNWETDYDLECVDAYWESQSFEDAEKVLTINYRSLGQGPVVLFDPNAEMGVRMLIMTDLLGNVQLVDYEVIDYVRQIPEAE